MRISVILSTYNSPDWLENVLWGYSVQTWPPLEIVIADDGSTPETWRRIESLRGATGLPIRHVWHADQGFRKCAILNAAIRSAQGDYFIFSDGDCIPRRDFVEHHARLARPGRFLSGGLLRLPLELSHKISSEDIRAGRATDAAWLRINGLPGTFKLLKLAAGPRWGWLWDQLTPTRATWNGHNASGWKSDLIAVNGFDERMQYGGEDRELGERLIHTGIRPMQIRHRAVCVHLEHARGYVSDEAWARNLQIWRDTLARRATWTDFGLIQKNSAQGPAQAA
ncbi:MAG: glycosyltransferase family 2 protein [Pirellulales bacterium]|nr:glycosyltransferase family 2 protein [Pirellulales bacterium]